MIDTIVSVVGIVAVVGIGFGCYAVACISPPVTKWLDMARPKESDQPEGNSYGITGNYRIAASDGPALKCPNPDCLDGYLQEFSAEGLRVKGNPCPTCHGTGEKPTSNLSKRRSTGIFE
jgi:hypothetical protein